MAISKYTQPLNIKPLDVFDEESFNKAASIKQMRYDQGLNQAQMLMNYTSKLDIINPGQKQYLQNKISSVIDQVNNSSGIDFSNRVELGKINSLISSVSNDPIIQNAVASSQKFRQYLKNKEALWTNPKHEELRDYDSRRADEEKEQEFLNSASLNSSWNLTTPSVNSGFSKEVKVIANEMKPIKGTELVEVGGVKYMKDYKYKDKGMMFNEVRNSVYSNGAHMDMLKKHFQVNYKDPNKKRELYDTYKKTRSLVLAENIKNLKARNVIDNSSQWKESIEELQEEYDQLQLQDYDDNKAFQAYVDQRIYAELPAGVNEAPLKVNSGFYQHQGLMMSAARLEATVKNNEANRELKKLQLIYGKNANLSQALLNGSSLPSHKLQNPIFEDPELLVPEKGKSFKNYSIELNTLTKNSHNKLKDSLLGILSHTNPDFLAELKTEGLMDTLKDKNKPLGSAAVLTLQKAKEKILLKQAKNQMLSPVEEDLVQMFDTYEKESVVVSYMKDQRDEIINKVVGKYGYDVKDYMQYKLDNKDEKGFFSNLFSTKTGLDAHIEDIEEELEKSFENSDENTFSVKNKYYNLTSEPPEVLKKELFNQIRKTGVTLDGKKYEINSQTEEESELIENVDFSKIEFNGKVRPGTDEIELTIPHKTVEDGKKVSAIKTFTAKVTPQLMGLLSNSVYGKNYNSIYQDINDDLDSILKKEGAILHNGKNLGFSLKNTTGLPLSNNVYYTYQNGRVNVNISGFGGFKFKENPPTSIKEAEQKLKALFTQSFQYVKGKNPNVSDEEALQMVLTGIKQKYAYR